MLGSVPKYDWFLSLKYDQIGPKHVSIGPKYDWICTNMTGFVLNITGLDLNMTGFNGDNDLLNGMAYNTVSTVSRTFLNKQNNA